MFMSTVHNRYRSQALPAFSAGGTPWVTTVVVDEVKVNMAAIGNGDVPDGKAPVVGRSGSDCEIPALREVMQT